MGRLSYSHSLAASTEVESFARRSLFEVRRRCLKYEKVPMDLCVFDPRRSCGRSSLGTNKDEKLGEI